MMVQEFRGRKFLSTSKEKSQIELIDDIGEVQDLKEESDDENSASASTSDKGYPAKISDVRVVGVIMDTYNASLKCHSKLIPDDDDADLAHCPKCKMMQCINASQPQLSAQLTIKDSPSDRCLSLRAFGKTVLDIAQKPADEVTKATLLKAKPFTLIHHDGIVHSITRKPRDH